MSRPTQLALDTFDSPVATKEHDYTLVIRRSREEPETSNITSLKVLAGRRFVQEAHLFFEELQAGLSSIDIQGNNVDELLCMLDWHRYILAVWTEQFSKANNVPDTKWMDIKESWETIIQAAVSLNLKYACSTTSHQRSALHASTDSLIFERFFHDSRINRILTIEDENLVESIIAATGERAWATPFLHEIAFTEMIDSVMDNLEKPQSSKHTKEQRRPGIQSSEFEGFIQILAKEIKLLTDLSPAKEQDALHKALSRALRTALLEYNYNQSIKHLQFHHSLISNWPFNNRALELEIDTIFQERVQKTFGCVISPTTFSRRRKSTPYAVEDLQNIIALGADVRGEVMGLRDCSLWAAAGSDCSIQLFEALVHAGAPYSIERDSSSSPLQAAARAGNLDIVAFLLRSKQHRFKIDINDSDRHGKTALHYAAEGCNESVVDFLLQQRKIDTNCQDSQWYTPFLLAIQATADRSKKYATIKRFVRNKSVDCNLRATDSVNGLHLAAMARDATLKIVLRHVQGINDQDWTGDTPLHKAVECNSKPNIDVLLKNGADPTIVNEGRLTPLLLACHKRHLGPMELLLSLPQSLTAQCPAPFGGSSYGSGYPIHEHWSPVTLVLQDLSGVGKRTLAHTRLALKIILAAKPDLEVRDGKGRSVLNRVVKTVDEGMLRDLLHAGADINSQDNRGRTPVHRLLSCYFPDHRKLKLLLEWGADPDIKDNDGEAAIADDWEDTTARYWQWGGKLKSVTRQHKAEKAKVQEQKSLQVLAEQAKAYAMKQKQEKTKKGRSEATRNPFSVLTVEEAGPMDDDT